MTLAILFSLKTVESLKNANPFWSNSIVFNENRIASVISALMMTLGINGPLAFMFVWFKDARIDRHTDSQIVLGDGQAEAE